MIGRVRGELVEVTAQSVTVDVGGLGYVISVTPRTLADLPGVGEAIVLHTHLHVREDQLALYGFDNAADKEVFSMLLGVSGVGPKVALAILATMTFEQLRAAVATDDLAALTDVPGIGKRSAQKLLLELKPRFDVMDEGTMSPSGPIAEVREALAGLGYAPDEIRGTLAEMPDDLTVEEMLKRSLQALGKARN